jgi:hypothetical protein
MLTMPDGIPLPLRDGYGFKPTSPIMRTPFVSGRARNRRRYRSVPTEVSVTWLCNAEQARMFEGWCKWGIGWADWFMCPIKSPLGLMPTQAQFTDIYDGPTLVGVDHWRYTAVLSLFEMPVISEAELTDMMAGMDLSVMNSKLRGELKSWYTKSWPGAT